MWSEVKKYSPAYSLRSYLELLHKIKKIKNIFTSRTTVVAGGQALMPEKNILIIDVGTCITYDLLAAEKNYLGGGISPGIKNRRLRRQTNTDAPTIRLRKDRAPR